MCEISTNNLIEVYRAYDPTNTTVLRNAFARDMERRFIGLTKVINKSVGINDAFGVNEFTSAPKGAFAFPRSTDKLASFMDWLDKQITAGILDVRTLQQIGRGVENAWTNKYLYDSYKRGVLRARYEMRKQKLNIPTVEAAGGIGIIMASTPFHIDRLGLIYTRAYSELKGITTAMQTQISRILAQGIADGDSIVSLARKLVSTINGQGIGDLGITDSLGRYIPAQRRADMLARTEIIRAHHQATIQEYMNWRIEKVFIKAEWMTARDNRVCSKCEKLQGEVFTLEEVMNMIPQHPLCRCIALPYIVKSQTS